MAHFAATSGQLGAESVGEATIPMTVMVAEEHVDIIDARKSISRKEVGVGRGGFHG